jgi:hypothetical protein
VRRRAAWPGAGLGAAGTLLPLPLGPQGVVQALAELQGDGPDLDCAPVKRDRVADVVHDDTAGVTVVEVRLEVRLEGTTPRKISDVQLPLE